MSSNHFFLIPSSIKNKIPSVIYERGMSVYITQQVLDYDVLYASASEWKIQGHVQGTERNPYWVTVTAEVSAAGSLTFFEGDCTCPVGRNCKHAVAITLKAAYKSARPSVPKVSPAAGTTTAPGVVFKSGKAVGKSKSKSNANADTKPASKAASATLMETLAELARLQALQQAQQQAEAQRLVQVRERDAAQNKVSQWLNLFGDADRSAADDAPGAARSPTGPMDDDVMVYGLSAVQHNGASVLQLSFGHSRVLRNGTWAKVKAVRYVEAYRTPPQDMEIVRLIQTMASQARSYHYTADDHCVLSGETGRLALQLADHSGRLFCLTGERKLGPPIHMGAARTMHWSWHEVTTLKASEPSWALRGQLDEAGQGNATSPTNAGDSDPILTRATWYANAPPLYLDPVLGECGPIEVPDLSAEHLALLLKAPPIPQSAFALNEATLLRRLAGLPLPPVLKAPQVLRDIAPVARLHIARVEPQHRASLGWLTASLRFDYDGLSFYNRTQQNPVLVNRHQADHPDQPAQSDQPDQRVLLHRDLGAEQKALASLRLLNLAADPQGVFHQADDFNAMGQQALRSSRWLQWADTDFAELRGAGFAVTPAPDRA